VLTAKSAFNLLLDGAYDAEVEAAVKEMDADKRARLTPRHRPEALRRLPRRDARDEGADVGVVEEGRPWPTLAYTVAETNYEYITPAAEAQRRPELVYRYIAGRLVQSLVSLFVVSVIVFALVRLSGDPIAIMAPAEATEKDIAAFARTSASTAPGPRSTGGF
jgi:hypothetical protein